MYRGVIATVSSPASYRNKLNILSSMLECWTIRLIRNVPRLLCLSMFHDFVNIQPCLSVRLLPLIQTRRLRFFGYVAQDKTRLEPYTRRFAGYPRTGGAAQDVHVAPGYGPWKQVSSRSITV